MMCAASCAIIIGPYYSKFQESKTQKMLLDAALLTNQHYKVRIKGKMEQSREWSSVLPYTSV